MIDKVASRSVIILFLSICRIPFFRKNGTEDDPETLQPMTAREVIGEKGADVRAASKGFHLFPL
jgi:hypothetical protein